MKYISKSENETKKIGKKIAAKLKGGEILALHGDLGAGKTVFAKGIIEGLGYKKNVNSPTFVLMKVYKLKIRNLKLEIRGGKNKSNVKYICHVDAYRIIDTSEIEDIGALEYFGKSDTVSIIEWPEKIKKMLPKNTIWVELNYGKKENERKIIFKK